ncbi:terminase gpP N-terminus-related DNA-binding protein [Trichococcus sp.]|uniref:terminase gpP N-terminus-related DNA-binding protein n=1 Tax=Trichococcus sp. TaxID=1985464 RepID=UPI003C7A5DE2
MVYLHLSGYQMKEMTQSIGHTRKTIGGYVASYRKGGIVALTHRSLDILKVDIGD